MRSVRRVIYMVIQQKVGGSTKCRRSICREDELCSHIPMLFADTSQSRKCLHLPAALTGYFISIYLGVAMGAAWTLNNPTYVYMNGWFHYFRLYAATAGCIGFMMLQSVTPWSIPCLRG